MVSSKSFSVNPKKAACRVKSYKERWFLKKVFKPFHNAFATKQWQKRCSIVYLFWLQKEYWEVSDIPKTRAFLLNKAHYLKLYFGSSLYRDQKLQCVEEYKYTSNQVRSC